MAFGFDNTGLDESLCPWTRYETKDTPMRLKVGQKVRVKTKAQLRKDFGVDEDYIMNFGMVCGHELGFNQEMGEFCGKMVTIQNITHDNDDDSNYKYFIRLKEVSYSWTDDMFDFSEEVTEKVHSEIKRLFS